MFQISPEVSTVEAWSFRNRSLEVFGLCRPLLGKSGSTEREDTAYKIKAYIGGAAETSTPHATTHNVGDTVIAIALW